MSKGRLLGILTSVICIILVSVSCGSCGPTNTGKTTTNYTLTTSPDDASHGSVTGGAIYASGTSVQLTATANSGWKFDHWSGDLAGSSSSSAVTMDSAKEITANFVKKAPFPWWWILVGIALLVPTLIIVIVAYLVATRRTGRS